MCVSPNEIKGRVSIAGMPHVAGVSHCGNCSPVDINVQDFKLTGDNVSSGGDFICVINSKGIAAGSYVWYADADTGAGKDGWFDMDGSYDFWDFDIKAGEGEYLFCAKAGVVLTIPCAIEAK